jgi:hypothetical protein
VRSYHLILCDSIQNSVWLYCDTVLQYHICSFGQYHMYWIVLTNTIIVRVNRTLHVFWRYWVTVSNTSYLSMSYQIHCIRHGPSVFLPVSTTASISIWFFCIHNRVFQYLLSFNEVLITLCHCIHDTLITVYLYWLLSYTFDSIKVLRKKFKSNHLSRLFRPSNFNCENRCKERDSNM